MTPPPRIAREDRPAEGLRRGEWVSRAASALCFALIVGAGAGLVQADTEADAQAKAEARAEAQAKAEAKSLSERLDSSFEAATADLLARVEQRADRVVERTARKQMAMLAERSEQNLAMSAKANERVAIELAILEHGSSYGIPNTGEPSVVDPAANDEAGVPASAAPR